ncbi:heavy metal translocating P-type ATPase [uncultured Flavonifractor sp.]|uniref:heavy metal translocating P-type ATPase n=1 Tax=uncultured Flavonifractor sp. TaxID=1193534 RepID=UPI00260920EA|nr:heavy metal translocating P-type ATPase [uncultured Flavonifractor sp.]
MSLKQKRMLTRLLAAALLFLSALSLPLTGWARLAAFLLPYAAAGWDVLWRAARNIAHGQVFDENFLMALATVGALAIGEYPEAVFVMVFYQVGELFQHYAVDQSRRSIAALMDIRPDWANVEDSGQLRQVDPEEVAVGDTIVIKPGERIPLDGVVLEGSSSLDTAALTGESLPRQVWPGKDVISGCVNLSGLLKVRVTRPFETSTVSRILELVENSSSKKARAEHFITRFARVYTPIVVLAAAALALLPPLLTPMAWVDSIQRALNFLVVSCPCALVISVPLSFFGGIGGASRDGILVKGGNYLEVLARAEIVVFDKTGTLTQGVFHVTAVHPEGCSEEELLELAALAESWSDHPISRSLKEAWGGVLDAARVSGAEELSGRGIRAAVDGRTLCAGNGRLMEEMGVSWHPCHCAGTTVHVAADGVYLGHIVISDLVKPDARQAVAALRSCGVRKCVLLTGDAQAAGEAVARELGMDQVWTQLLPAHKVERVEALLEECSPRGALVFVGDGINDAPVLSRADVGIAMGGLGSDAAIEAADIVLMDDRPSKIAHAITIARHTLTIVRQNIVFALGIKLMVLVLSALGYASMWAAVFADVGVSVLAILNAMRCLRRPKRL